MIDLTDAGAYDAAVAAMEGIDRWCSSTDWVLPLSASMGATSPFVRRTASGWGVFDRLADPEGRPVLIGADRVWGFATAVVGPPATFGEVADALADDDWAVLLLPGLVEGSTSWDAAVSAHVGRSGHRLFRAATMTRCRADLADGVEGWRARRSPRFRRALDRGRAEAARAGVVVDELDAGSDGTAVDLLVEIEQRSWKGDEGEGLCTPEFADFYRLVLDRLGPERRTRLLVARLDGRPVAYIVGGVRDATYRGLQLGFDDDHRALSLGHVLQAEQVERLVAEGVTTYDLGMDMPYKRRWSDHELTTTTIAVVRDR